MKTKIFLVLIAQLIFVQSLFSAAEIRIYNRSSETLKLVVYPIGAIFNGDKKYDLTPTVFSGNYSFIFGGQKSGITLNQSFELDQDKAPSAEGEASIGFGKYRVVFYKLNSGYDSVNYCDIDFSDSDYPYTGDPYLSKDLIMEYNSSSNITYHFGGGSISIPGSKLITSWDQRTSGNTSAYKTQNKNGFRSSSGYPNWPINAMDDGAVNHTYLNEVYVNLFLRDNGINIITNKTLKFVNSIFTIKDTTTFTMNSGSTLYMDGGNFRTFQTNGLKTITVGNGALINMYMGSAINLNNTKFQLASGASSWRGIKTTNSLFDSITYCEFNGADTCLSIYNSDKCWAQSHKIISGNTFNNGKVLLRNVFHSLVEANTFSFGNSLYGLIISNNVHPNDIISCVNEDPNPFSLNIVSNNFSGGNVQVFINGLASDLTPVYISGNEFQGTSVFGTRFGIATIKAYADVKGNVFTSDEYEFCSYSIESEINLLGNVLKGSEYLSTSVELFSSSSALLGPLYDNEQFHWYGGVNQLYSSWDNIDFYEGSDVLIDNGYNCFNMVYGGETQIIGELSGGICNMDLPFPGKNNYWSAIPPETYIVC